MQIAVEDPAAPDILALLRIHLSDAVRQSPPGESFALDPEVLRAPAITFWAARADGRLLGVGALKRLGDGAGEVKSMHTAHAARGRGIGRQVLQTIIGEARRQGLTRLLLETGNNDAYAPARALYRRAGFTECGPFADYRDNGFSVFMALELRG